MIDICMYTHIYILALSRAYPGTKVWLIDPGGCGFRCNDETLRILIRMSFRILVRTVLDLELEPDRSRCLRNHRICRRLERNQRFLTLNLKDQGGCENPEFAGASSDCQGLRGVRLAERWRWPFAIPLLGAHVARLTLLKPVTRQAGTDGFT